MKVDVVIPNYNGASLIEKNLRSVIVALEPFHGSQIIIVDDFSIDADYRNLEAVVSAHKNITLLRNHKNLGFSSTVNRGVKESNADLVVLLNSDVSPERNFLKDIEKDFKEEVNLFGIGCMDKSIEGEKVILRGRGRAFWRRGFLMHAKGEPDREDTFWISGGSSIIRREIYIALGGFDELYNPFYWEDIDLSYRAQKSGYHIKFDLKRVVEHRHEEGAIKKNYKSHEIKKIAYRNQLIFVWKNITDIKLLISNFIFLPYHLFKSIINRDWAFLQGFILAVLLLPAIINKRLSQARIYTKHDSDLIK